MYMRLSPYEDGAVNGLEARAPSTNRALATETVLSSLALQLSWPTTSVIVLHAFVPSEHSTILMRLRICAVEISLPHLLPHNFTSKMD